MRFLAPIIALIVLVWCGEYAGPAFAAPGAFAARHPGAYRATTTRMVGVKIGALGGFGSASDGVDTGGTYRQQFCTGAGGVSNFKLSYPAWYLDGTGEHPFANAIGTVKSSVEYPTGALTTVKVGGSASWSVPAGAEPISDTIAVAVPPTTCFFVKTYLQVTSGQTWWRARSLQLTNGEGYQTGSDQTAATGALPSPAQSVMYGPTSMLAASNKPAVCILGDSIAAGAHDTPTTTGSVLNLVGYIERALSNHLAWHTDTRNSNELTFVQNAHAMQFLAGAPANCPAALIELGTNDMYLAGLSLTQEEAVFLAVANLYDAAGVPVYATTILPRVSCATDCSTLLDQTPDPVIEAERQAYNTWLLARPVLASGAKVTTWDCADVARDRGGDISRWRVDLGQPTDDGTHPLSNITPTLAGCIKWWTLK